MKGATAFCVMEEQDSKPPKVGRRVDAEPKPADATTLTEHERLLPSRPGAFQRSPSRSACHSSQGYCCSFGTARKNNRNFRRVDRADTRFEGRSGDGLV
jgi:hypothetical protein